MFEVISFAHDEHIAWLQESCLRSSGKTYHVCLRVADLPIADGKPFAAPDLMLVDLSKLRHVNHAAGGGFGEKYTFLARVPMIAVTDFEFRPTMAPNLNYIGRLGVVEEQFNPTNFNQAISAFYTAQAAVPDYPVTPDEYRNALLLTPALI